MWASIEDKLCKVWKCRWCPYVSGVQGRVAEHEGRHSNAGGGVPEDSIKCPYCSYHAVVISGIATHVKVK